MLHFALIVQVVHLRRPTMQSWDGWLHVNPYGYGSAGLEVGVAMLFNPTDAPITTTISLPLYYTGLSDQCMLSVNDGAFVSVALDRLYNVAVALVMPPRSIHTIVVHHA